MEEEGISTILKAEHLRPFLAGFSQHTNTFGKYEVNRLMDKIDNIELGFGCSEKFTIRHNDKEEALQIAVTRADKDSYEIYFLTVPSLMESLKETRDHFVSMFGNED